MTVYPVIWDEELHEYRPMRWAEILESRRLHEQSRAEGWEPSRIDPELRPWEPKS